MSRQYIEDIGSTVNGPPCSYSDLSNYNTELKPWIEKRLPTHKTTKESFTVAPSKNSGSSQPSHYIVPAYDAPGYNTLMHEVDKPSCSGYFNVINAYRNDGSNCNCNQKYLRKLYQN